MLAYYKWAYKRTNIHIFMHMRVYYILKPSRKFDMFFYVHCAQPKYQVYTHDGGKLIGVHVLTTLSETCHPQNQRLRTLAGNQSSKADWFFFIALAFIRTYVRCRNRLDIYASYKNTKEGIFYDGKCCMTKRKPCETETCEKHGN